MRPRGAAYVFFGFIVTLYRASVLAEDHVTFAPAVAINTVHDDNLFFSRDAAARDVIVRVTPSLETRFASPRLTIKGDYAFDADRYATYTALSHRLARQRAAAGVDYRVSPRLSLGLDGTFTNTDTPSELNILSGLAAARLRARRFELTPSARFILSPRLTMHGALVSTHDSLSDGSRMQSQFLLAGLDRRVTPRDEFKLDSELGRYAFNRSSVAVTTNTFVVRGGWAHDFDRAMRLTLSAGPRLTEGSITPEIAVSVTQRFIASSVTLSAFETQTTAVGVGKPLDVRGVNAMFTYMPTRLFTAYVAPAILRSARRDLQTTVYRIAFGGRYAITPFAAVDLSYSRDSQRGAIDPLLAANALSRSVLSVGFTTHWNVSENR